MMTLLLFYLYKAERKREREINKRQEEKRVKSSACGTFSLLKDTRMQIESKLLLAASSQNPCYIRLPKELENEFGKSRSTRAQCSLEARKEKADALSALRGQ
jgi:hypothetical protein